MFAIVLSIVLVAGAFPALAQTDTKAGAAPAAAPAQKPAKRGPQKVVEMDPLEVIGKVQKPHVFYVIERGDLKYKGLPLERSLLKEVEDSVNSAPF